MKLKFSMLLLAGTALTSPVFAQGQAPGANMQPTLADCDSAIAILDQHKSADAGVTLDQVKTLRLQKNAQGCHDMLLRVDPAAATRDAQNGDSGQIVVHQAAQTLKVEQAAPQVTVSQAQPSVSVNQGMPQIFVHQPAATVTIDIPQPEITVKMPKPDVNVAMAQPKVDVTQAKPQVQVVQPSQPQVQVQRAEAQVSVQQSANAEPKVSVEGGGQAQVHYDRAEPKVVINQAKGQPQIKVEHMDATPGTAATAPDTTAKHTTMEATTNTANDPKGATPHEMAVSQINALSLYNANGDDLGDIERVVMGKDSQPSIVIGNGGFLGLGEKRVAIPLQQTAMRGNRLVIQGLTDDQIRAMPTWSKSSGDHELAKDKMVPISIVR